MEFLVQLEKREKRVYCGPLQAQEGTRVLKELKETGDPQVFLASLAEKGPWEMLGLEGPQA